MNDVKLTSPKIPNLAAWGETVFISSYWINKLKNLGVEVGTRGDVRGDVEPEQKDIEEEEHGQMPQVVQHRMTPC